MYNMDLVIIRKITTEFFKSHVVDNALEGFDIATKDRWTSIMMDVLAGVDTCVQRGDVDFIRLLNEAKCQYITKEREREQSKMLHDFILGNSIGY